MGSENPIVDPHCSEKLDACHSSGLKGLSDAQGCKQCLIIFCLEEDMSGQLEHHFGKTTRAIGYFCSFTLL